MYSYILYAVVGLVILFVVYKVVTDKTWINKIIEFVKGIFAGFKSILKTESPLLFVFHSIAIWVCYFSAFYVCFFALPETASLSPWAALGVTFFGALAYTAVQGGVGAYPLVVGKFLVVYSIIESIGLAFGWLVWTVQTGLVIIGGVLALLILAIINKS